MARCALCNKKIKPPKRKFCCNKHKDRYHNIHNPRGYFAHLNPKNMDDMDAHDVMDWYHDSVHPHDSEALGQD